MPYHNRNNGYMNKVRRAGRTLNRSARAGRRSGRGRKVGQCGPNQHWMPPANGRAGYCMSGKTHRGNRKGRWGRNGLGNTGYKGTFQSPFNYQFGSKSPSNQMPYTVTHPWQRGTMGQEAALRMRVNTHNPTVGSYNNGF